MLYANDNLESKLKILRFAVHVWGEGSSLYISTRCIHQVAKENRTQASPITVNALINNTYVDDLLKSVDTTKQAKIIYRESTELFSDSGFKLTKWSANAEDILQIIPKEARAPASRIIMHGGSPSQVHGTMGLQWDPVTDCLSLAAKNLPPPVNTCRGMLS